MKQLITTVFFLYAFLCGAQTYNFGWAGKVGGTGFDSGNSIVSDPLGNTYTLGHFAGTADLNPGAGIFNLTSAGMYDIFISKTDPNGGFLWAVRIGGSNFDAGNAIAQDPLGNLYLTGTFNGTVDFDPGTGVFNLVSAGATDCYVLKLDSNGGFIWAKKFGGTDADISRSLVVDNAGNSYLTGEFLSTVDFDPGVGVFNLISNGNSDIFILKLDAGGNFLWAKNVGGTSFDNANSIAIDGSGNSCIGGRFSGTVDFDPGAGTTNLTPMGTYDGYILKLDPLGNFSWVKQISGSGNDDINEIAIDNTGNIYYTGPLNATVDMDPGIAVSNLTSNGAIDCFISKLDAGGNFVWAKSIGGTGNDEAMHISVNGSNRIDISGYFENTIDFDPGLGVTNRTSNGSWDAFIVEFDGFGNFSWVKQFGGSNDDICLALDYDNLGNIYTTGYFALTVDFNSEAGVFNLVSNGQSDAFVQKLIRDCTSASSIIASDCVSYTVPSGHETYTASGTYMDNIANAANCDSIITINLTIADAAAPIANTTTLANITAQCSVTSFTTPTATDNCAGTITGTHNATLPITTQGTTVVIWTFADGNGNSSTQTQNVIITDNTAPVANTATLSDVTAQCSVSSLTAPTVTDNCAGTITGTHNVTLPITTQGTTSVIWTYNDGNGNTSTQTQNVIINDNTAPVANTATLSDVTAQCSVTSLTAPTATDNCAGTITGTHNATLPITTQGTISVIWTYNDGNGNTSTQTQNVIVTLPVATTTLSGITISATTSGAAYQWIDCGNGNTPINDATSQSFTATQNGTYAVIVTQNGCSSTSSCVTISTVGMEELSQASFTLYPNPNNGTFKVVTDAPTTIRITNAAGQLISTQMLEPGESIIELINVESGVYFVSAIHSNGQVSVQRISVF